MGGDDSQKLMPWIFPYGPEEAADTCDSGREWTRGPGAIGQDERLGCGRKTSSADSPSHHPTGR